MKLEQKILMLFVSIGLLTVLPLLWTIHHTAQRIDFEDVIQRGQSKAIDLAEKVVPEFKPGHESTLLPFLQAAQEQSGALYVAAIAADAMVLAHTNVAEQGRFYVDQNTHDDLNLLKPDGHKARYKNSLVMEIAVPVWSQTQAPSNEDFLLGGDVKPALKAKLGVVRLGLPLEPVLARERRTLRMIAFIILSAGVAGMTLIYLFIRRILRPVSWLSSGTRRIAEGEYGIAVPIHSKDELGDLARDFNRMSLILKDTTVSKDMLEEKERYFRSLIENTSDVITVLDSEGTIQYESPSVHLVLGYEPQELLGTAALQYIHPDDQKGILELLQNGAKSPGEPYAAQYRFKHKNGLFRFLESVGTYIPGEGAGGRTVFNSRDVTDRRQTDEQRRLLVAAMEQSRDSIMITDAEGIIQYVNRAFESVAGYTRSEVIGKNPRILKSGSHDRAFYAAMWATLKSGKDWEHVIVNKRKDGTLYEEEASICPVTGDDGRITHFVAVKRNIAERRKMESILRQSDKMSAVGQLAAGVAHEINNPLGVILGFAQALVRRMAANDPLEMPLKSIEREAIRCKNLVQDLLTFARVTKVELEPMDLNRTIEGAISLVMARAHTVKVDVRMNLASGLPSLHGNANQIQQVIINLANNAFDAMEKTGGVLSIATNSATKGPLTSISLRVTDTGTGIPADILPRVFDPFFTTKPVGKGTGLGLSLIHELVKKHSGTLDLQSRPGCTEFLLTFPIRLPEGRNHE